MQFLSMLLSFALVLPAAASVCENRRTDLSLVLAIDVSGSIDDQEVRTQLEGYQKAINHPSVINNLLNCQCTAIGVLFWAAEAQMVFPMRRMESLSDIEALNALLVNFLDRTGLSYELGLSYTTELVNALSVSRDYLLEQRENSDGLMIMISGDGYDSRLMATLEELRMLRAQNERDGIVVHGLPLDIYRFESDFADTTDLDRGPLAPNTPFVSPYPKVSDYYREEVITSTGSVEVSESFVELEQALIRSLTRNTCQLMM